MARVKLKDVIKRVNTKVDKDNTDLIYYVGGEHIESENIHVEKRGLIAGSTIGPMFYYGFKAGDFLLVSRNPHLKKAGIVDFDGICSEKTFVLATADPEVLLPEFLPFTLQNDRFWEYAYQNRHGSTNTFINWSTLSNYEFDLPDLYTQHKLAEVLWSINYTREAYKKLISATDDLVKSQFIEMFYGKGYPVKAIGDVIDKKISRAAKVFDKTDEIQYLDISSIDNTTKTVTGFTAYALKDAPSRAQYVLQKDDIMYSTVRPNLQNIAINPYSDGNVVGSTGFCVLRCTGVTTGYMWGVINSVPFTESMINQASGANYPAVTDKVVHAYEIPIPPEEEQRAYEQLVRQSDKSKFELEQALVELTATYKRIIAENLG